MKDPIGVAESSLPESEKASRRLQYSETVAAAAVTSITSSPRMMTTAGPGRSPDIQARPISVAPTAAFGRASSGSRGVSNGIVAYTYASRDAYAPPCACAARGKRAHP